MAFDPVSMGIAAGTQGISSLINIFKGAHQNNLANRVVVPQANYTVSPYAQNVLAEAQRLKNSQMPGSAQATQNIYNNQANTMDSVERNSSSGALSLSMLGAAQGNTNNAFNNQSQLQNAYTTQMGTNWNNANNGMTDEMHNLFQDQLRKRQEAIAEKTSLRGAATQSIGQGMNGIQNGAMLYAQMKNGQN